MSAKIVIVDTGSGNLRSLHRALTRVGGRAEIVQDADSVARADVAVVPGQGAFHSLVDELRARDGLEEAVRAFIASGRPFLGICVGMQMLFDTSEEEAGQGNAVSEGLGYMPGYVARFRPKDHRYKVPHMGWNRIRRAPHLKAGTAEDDPLLRGIDDGAHVYFVHSYYAVPKAEDDVALFCDYELPFAAAVRRDNVFACQFHPEKSHAVGLRLLANFVEESP